MAPDFQHESILEFPNPTKRSRRAGETRCGCGSPMTKQKTTFFYDGRRWKVTFRVCLKCYPTLNVPITYDA
jgi:hypothetical protein